MAQQPSFIVQDIRQGVQVFVPGRGLLTNGRLDADAADRLREVGARIVPHVWREPQPSQRELEERLAADAVLGRVPDEAGRTQTDRDIDKAMRKLTRPMRKSELFAKQRRW